MTSQQRTRVTHRVAPWQWAVYIVVSIAPMILALIALPHLPARIVTHWDLQNRPDGWGPPVNALILPAVGLGLSALMAAITIWLSDDDRAGGTQRALFYAGLATVVVWAVLVAADLAGAMGTRILGYRPDTGSIITDCVAVLVAALGNACPAAPPNAIFGIRTPAAQADPWVWYKTQVVGGRLLVAAGVLTLIANVVYPAAAMAVLVVLLLAAVVVAMGYSSYLAGRPHPSGRDAARQRYSHRS